MAGYWFTDGHSRSVTLGQSPPTARPIVNPISRTAASAISTSRLSCHRRVTNTANKTSSP
jgi:hypothetical protein